MGKLLNGWRWMTLALPLGFLFWAFATLATSDISAFADDDLHPALRPALQPSENGAAALAEFPYGELETIWRHASSRQLSEIATADRFDPQISRRLTEVGENIKRSVRESLHAPGFQLSHFVDGPEAREVPFIVVVTALDLALIEAELHLRDDRELAAIDNLIANESLTRRLRVAEASQTLQYVTVSLAAKGRKKLLDWLARGEISQAGLETLHSYWREEFTWSEGMARACRLEYRAEVARLQRVVRRYANLPDRSAAKSEHGSIKPNATKYALAQLYRWRIRNLSEDRLWKDIEPKPSTAPSWTAWSNSLGLEVLDREVSSGDEAELFFLDRFDFAAIRCLIAIRLFETRAGRQPESLSELVPEFLTAVPIDPYDGKPLRYSANRRRVWAVGQDLESDDGQGASCHDKFEPSVRFE